MTSLRLPIHTVGQALTAAAECEFRSYCCHDNDIDDIIISVFLKPGKSSTQNPNPNPKKFKNNQSRVSSEKGDKVA